jgi:wyosine [tRNA(Phe)-imidazoG37] synthetase (radical SAM superfamily)
VADLKAKDEKTLCNEAISRGAIFPPAHTSRRVAPRDSHLPVACINPADACGPHTSGTVMNSIVEPGASVPEMKSRSVFAYPRDPLGNRFVYIAISSRARGLSVGVNLSPDKHCTFNCVYCEVDRHLPGNNEPIDLDVMAAELESTLNLVQSGKLRGYPPYARLPIELMQLRHVAISGNGEPTLCPQFRDAVETMAHVRATSPAGFFKIVLITNASNLDAPEVQSGLGLLTRTDEIWAKLDAGTQAHMDRINQSDVRLEKVCSNILLIARHRPVIIQSLFPSLNGHGPTDREIEDYAQRLKQLKDAGAQVPLVQIYSAARPTQNPDCGHLPLRVLSQIAQTVRKATGLNAEVF